MISFDLTWWIINEFEKYDKLTDTETRVIRRILRSFRYEFDDVFIGVNVVHN